MRQEFRHIEMVSSTVVIKPKKEGSQREKREKRMKEIKKATIIAFRHNFLVWILRRCHFHCLTVHPKVAKAILDDNNQPTFKETI